jgi:hypothetical protein
MPELLIPTLISTGDPVGVVIIAGRVNGKSHAS